MMPPISRDLLIHDVDLNAVEKNKFGEETDRLIDHLYFVRIEPSNEVVVTNDNANVQCTGKMFVDSCNTIPVGVPIVVGNTVVWDGNRYRVRKVDQYFDNVRLHHTEVLLSDG